MVHLYVIAASLSASQGKISEGYYLNDLALQIYYHSEIYDLIILI